MPPTDSAFSHANTHAARPGPLAAGRGRTASTPTPPQVHAAPAAAGNQTVPTAPARPTLTLRSPDNADDVELDVDCFVQHPFEDIPKKRVCSLQRLVAPLDSPDTRLQLYHLFQ